jgi:hypothetical protein
MMITYPDQIDIERALKDAIYEMRNITNSISVKKHFPEVTIKCREMELFLKGMVLEVKDMETEDDE